MKKFSKKNVDVHPGYAMEYWKLVAFFADDPTIEVGDIDDENKSCDIIVDDEKKAAILDRALNCKYLKVNVIYDGSEEVSESDIDYLCKDNPLYVCMMECDTMKALMFAPECIHYFSDDMFSPTGHTALLPYQLASQLFTENLNYQTYLTDECDCCDDECCDECWDCDDECDDCDVCGCPLCDEDDDEEIEGIKIEVKHLPKNAGKILYDILSDIAEMCDEEE